jgi:NAD(P) transhydrogenase subunit beta
MLVGASGSILTKQMADAMNRSIGNVFFGGFGGGGGPRPRSPTTAWPHRAVDQRGRRRDPALLRAARRRRAGLRHGRRAGAARGRRPRAELEKRGVEVLYAIHPVAGRMPGT